MIYFIKYGEDRVKIGYTSRSVEKRFYELQQEAPNMKLEVLVTMEGDKKKESELHDKFRAICVGNEYFKYNNDIVNFLDKLKKIEYCGLMLNKKEYAYMTNILLPGQFRFCLNWDGLGLKESPQFYFKDTGENLNIVEESYFDEFIKWAILIDYHRDTVGRVVIVTDGYRHEILYRSKKGNKLVSIPATISLCGGCGKYYYRECFNDWSCNKCMRDGDSFEDPYGKPYSSHEENFFIDCDIDIRLAKSLKEQREREMSKTALQETLKRIKDKRTHLT